MAWYKAKLEQAETRLNAAAKTTQPPTTNAMSGSEGEERSPEAQKGSEGWTTVRRHSRRMKTASTAVDNNTLPACLAENAVENGMNCTTADQMAITANPAQDEITKDK